MAVSYLIRVTVVVLLIGSIVCPPVDKKKPAEKKDPNAVPNNELEVIDHLISIGCAF